MNDVQRQNYRGNEAALAWRAEVDAARGEERSANLEAEKQGIAALITREAAAAWAACGAFECVALGYLAALSALIAVFAENHAHPVKLFGAQALVAATILVLCRVQARVAERAEWRGDTFSAKFWHFWRHWYPHLFFLFCFEELGKVVHLVTPGWQDTKLIAADYWLTGVPPTVWLEHFGRVRGAAFPSEHVAGSVAALWGAWRHRRWLFWAMLPLVTCMCVSTVWGRYHYVVDVFGGMATGTLGYMIGRWVMKTRGAVATEAP